MLFVGLRLFKAQMNPSYFLECMALFRFHSFSVPSSEAVSNTAWPGWKVSARIASKWLRSVKRGFHVFLNSSLLSCIWWDKQRSCIRQTAGWNTSYALFQNRGVITSMERSLSLATVRSASSPRFISPPPTASIMKTSEEKPRAPPDVREGNTRVTEASWQNITTPKEAETSGKKYPWLCDLSYFITPTLCSRDYIYRHRNNFTPTQVS